MGKSASLFTKGKVIALADEGLSIRAIAGKVGMPRSIVSDCIRNFRTRGTVECGEV